MSVDIEKFNNMEEVKKEIKKELVDQIFSKMENKESVPLDNYWKSYEIITYFSFSTDKESESLFLYHNEIIKDYLVECFKIISLQSKEELIDLFLNQTDNIIFLFYWLNLHL